MPDPDRGHHEKPDLDADDFAAIEQAMGRLANQEHADTGEFSPQFPDVESWVGGFFVRIFRRPGSHWCAQWWDHPEAVLRLEALWRTWEAAALDPVSGTATWTRDYLDPNLSVLFSADGPLGACSADRHTRPPALPVTAPPPRWWTATDWWQILAEPDR
jgi:hypothetical protein